jgi:predicted dehydrogenase
MWMVAGYGDVVVRRVLPALREANESVNWIWGRNRDRARATAERHGAGGGTDDLARALADAEVVYVATPVVTHVPLALAAVRAGRPVLVEKPLSGGLQAGVAELLDLARRSATPVGVAYYRRLAPALVRLRTALAAGSERHLAVDFRAPFAPAAGDPMYWRTRVVDAGGGVLSDAGCHRLDLACWLLGRPDRVSARLWDRFPDGAERRAELNLWWARGATAAVTLRWTAGPGRDRLDIATGAPADPAGPGVPAWPAVRLDPLDGGTLWWRRGAEVWGEPLPPPANPHTPLIRDFVRAVHAGTPPVCPVHEAALVDAVIVAAQCSDRAGGAAVHLDPGEP